MTRPTSSKIPVQVSPQAAKGHIDPMWHSVPTAIARRFHQICVAKTSELVGQAGLTPLQYGALLHLSKTTGVPGIEQNNLAERINIDRNTASLLVEQLVRKGLVERRVNGADRRARLLSLTSQGEMFCARLRPAHLTLNKEILAPLAPREQKLLIGLLIRVIEGNLAQANRDSGGRLRRTRHQRTET
jgi:MarR family transcriptional regulator, lower aerobic nicotinate degradation pathway regulator